MSNNFSRDLCEIYFGIQIKILSGIIKAMHPLMSSDVFFKTKSLGDISLSLGKNSLESFPRGFPGVPPVIFSWLPLELISSDSFRNSFLFFFLTYLSRNTNKDNFKTPCEFQSMILRFAEILYRSLDKNL